MSNHTIFGGKMKTITFKGVKYGQPKKVEGQGYVTPGEPFEMTCVLEKECVAVSPDGLHCWVKFLDGSWRFGYWDNYRLDSVE